MNKKNNNEKRKRIKLVFFISENVCIHIYREHGIQPTNISKCAERKILLNFQEHSNSVIINIIIAIITMMIPIWLRFYFHKFRDYNSGRKSVELKYYNRRGFIKYFVAMREIFFSLWNFLFIYTQLEYT